MASDSFSESSPASDADPYDSSSFYQANYNIDRERLPKPVPIIGPLLGYDDKFFAKVTRLKIERASASLKRPLSSEEANAMAYYGAKQISIVSYSTPVGVIGGAWRCWDTRHKFRFPFWGPNMETFKPNQFPNGTVFYEGPQARQLWHLFRALFYVGFGKFAAGMLLGSYAMSVAAVGEMNDPRLKGLQDVFKREAATQVARRRAIQSGMQGVKPPPPDVVGGTVQGAQSGGDGVERPYDDASPTGGIFYDEMREPGKPSVVTASEVNEPGQPQTRSTHGRWPQESPRQQQDQQPQDNDTSPFMVFDDASPTGGQGMSIDASAQPTSSGSAWERIRSGQRPLASRPRPDEQSQRQGHEQSGQTSWSEKRSASRSSGSDNSFVASNAQEGRMYSREEAQKEFDAKVERERRGGDFSSGTGDQKRW